MSGVGRRSRRPPEAAAAQLDVKAPFSIPMRRAFRGVTVREGVVVAGPEGWGEFSPFPEYPPEVCARWLAAAREAASRPWPAPVRDLVAVNAIVPAVGPEEAHAIVAGSGCQAAKVKVGDAGDLARVEAVRDALGPGGGLRVDVNAAWDVDTAARRLRELARFDLEYAEQPVATIPELAALRRQVEVPLAADESIRLADDPVAAAVRVREERAADIAILKVQPLGGVWPALEVAEAAGLPLVVSSAVETSVGLAAGLALAAALPELPYACGLGTQWLLAGDLVAEPLVPVGGYLEVRRPAVSAALLDRWAPPEVGAARLLDRLAAADRAAGVGGGTA